VEHLAQTVQVEHLVQDLQQSIAQA
jgi:hypothetical protein